MNLTSDHISYIIKDLNYRGIVMVYAIAGLSALLIAWITMGYQSVKAATTNPVTSLKSE